MRSLRYARADSGTNTAVSGYVAVVAGTFAFFYPVLAGLPLSHAEWVTRMWFPSWF